MELQLTFDNPKPQTIPIDYQYYLSSWMYKVMNLGNPEYAHFLHDHGYKVAEDSAKIFKLFCFSWLTTDRFDINTKAQTMTMKGDTVRLKARFHVDESLKTFVKGLFKDQNLTIKNGFDVSASFNARSIDMVEVAQAQEKTIIRALSPLVISVKQANGNDLYLAPTEEGYADKFFHNLIDKYKSTGVNIPDSWQPDTWKIMLIRPERIRRKLMNIKPNGENIRVAGYQYDFVLEAPPEIIRTGLLAGFGKHCAQGFGYGEVING